MTVEQHDVLPVPRLSATMIVVREASGANGMEVMAIKRSQNLRVLPGFTVFPGGVMDEMDVYAAKALTESGIHLTPPTFEMLEAEFKGQVISRDALYVSLFAAGARELLEETGIYMGSGRVEKEQIASIRSALLHGQGSEWIDLFQSESSWYPFRYVGRRVTPKQVKHRFDAHFFIVEVPQDKVATPSPDEVETVIWSTPGALLSGFQNDYFHMAPPTVDALLTLDQHPSLEALMEKAIMPLQVNDDERINRFLRQLSAN